MSRRSDTSILCVPLVYGTDVLGMLCLERDIRSIPVEEEGIAALSVLASQASIALTVQRLDRTLAGESQARRDAEGALRETHNSMIKHQQIGRMGDFRLNTRTLESRGSAECYKMFGYDFSSGHVPYSTWAGKLHPDDIERVKRVMFGAFAERRPLSFEYRILVDGEVRHISSEGQPEVDANGDLIYWGVVTDVTERKAAEEALRNAQAELAKALRLASIGELAGSIVHEINQPLTAIITSAETCKRWLDGEPPRIPDARISVVRVIQESERAAAVVAGLRNLARGSEIRLADLELNEAVQEVLLVAGADLSRAGVGVRSDLDPNIPTVRGDRVQIQQVVFNLIRNSIEAMIDVTDRRRVLLISSRITEDAHAEVTLTDSGEGIEASKREHLFDALFSTKGAGMGFGLSICRKIIKAHNGRIQLVPNPDHGVTFSFALPLSPHVAGGA